MKPEPTKAHCSEVHTSTCPACGHALAASLMAPFRMPLATIAWPDSAEQAKAMKQLPHSFVRCLDCGHVYNMDFRYSEVPYSEKPNLMFNRGQIWTTHLVQTADLLLSYLPMGGTAIEIGCGEGHLLRHMAAKRRDGRFIGFDPNASFSTDGRFMGRSEYFVPAQHIETLQPDLIVCRHVIEHLLNPLGFLQSIQFYASRFNLRTRVYVETPCVDRALENSRIVDFYYEHYSHFTTSSFTRMVQKTSHEIDLLTHNYNREVISGIFRVGCQHGWIEIDNQTTDFRTQASISEDLIAIQLEQILAQNKSIAVWGGTGKAAVFINRYRLDAGRFPCVVDSDPEKVGTYVPGQGQEIKSRDHLLDNPVDVVIIPMAWRAHDVILEMIDAGIQCQTILVEHRGSLVDFYSDQHPYAGGQTLPKQSVPTPHYNPASPAYWSVAAPTAPTQNPVAWS